MNKFRQFLEKNNAPLNLVEYAWGMDFDEFLKRCKNPEYLFFVAGGLGVDKRKAAQVIVDCIKDSEFIFKIVSELANDAFNTLEGYACRRLEVRDVVEMQSKMRLTVKVFQSNCFSTHIEAVRSSALYALYHALDFCFASSVYCIVNAHGLLAVENDIESSSKAEYREIRDKAKDDAYYLCCEKIKDLLGPEMKKKWAKMNWKTWFEILFEKL